MPNVVSLSCASSFAILLLGGAVLAHDQSLQPGVTGDWDGMRSQWQDQGWQFQGKTVFEGGFNPSGGAKEAATGAGELDVAALADLGKLIGDGGGSLEAKITDRFGAKLDRAAGLSTLMQTQEIYGRGDIWRLTELSFAQDMFDKKANIELGRMNPGADFAVFSCDFQNLAFCGAAPGNIDGDYWFNAPVGEWGARLQLNSGDGLGAAAGVYQINPANLTRGFSLDFSGGKGELIPYQLEWKGDLMSGLPGDYKAGAWYATINAPDVFFDVARAPLLVSGRAPLLDRGRKGFYLMAQQQVTGEAPAKDAAPGTNGQGLTLFANYTQSDRRTSLLDNQFTVGAVYKGAFEDRPDDEIALAFGGTHVNSRVARGEGLHNTAGLLPFMPVQHTEYVTELDYRFLLVPGALLTPNLQYIADPGGVGGRDDVLVLGLKAALTL